MMKCNIESDARLPESFFCTETFLLHLSFPLGYSQTYLFFPKKSDSDQTVMSVNGINKIKKSFLALWNLHSAEKWVVIWTVTTQFQCVLFTGSCLKWISRSLQAFSMEVCHFRIYSTEFLSYATCYNALDFFFFSPNLKTKAFTIQVVFMPFHTDCISKNTDNLCSHKSGTFYLKW